MSQASIGEGSHDDYLFDSGSIDVLLPAAWLPREGKANGGIIRLRLVDAADGLEQESVILELMKHHGRSCWPAAGWPAGPAPALSPSISPLRDEGRDAGTHRCGFTAIRRITTPVTVMMNMLLIHMCKKHNLTHITDET